MLKFEVFSALRRRKMLKKFVKVLRLRKKKCFNVIYEWPLSLKSIQPQSTVKYKERMYEETLVLITGGVFSLAQICEAVLILSKFYPNDKKRSIEMTDSLWTGILSKDLELCDPKSVVAVFRTLPCLNQSRDLGMAHDMYLRIYESTIFPPFFCYDKELLD